MTTANISAALAAFACDTEPLDSDARHAGRQALANCLGLMAGSCDHPAARKVRGTFGSQNRGTRASVIGRRRKIPLLLAALSNGISAHVEDFDDTSLPSILHPSAPVIPAALAAAEQADATGRELLDAVLVGMEIGIRVADGITPRALDRGWHITGLIGPIGAAAAAGRILRLDRSQMESALSMAAVQGAGVQAALGTMTKSLHAGRAAANGLESAFMSRSGFAEASAGLEARDGLAAAAADWLDGAKVLRLLGTDWRVRSNLIKPAACGVVSHPAIAAATQIRAAADEKAPLRITRIAARVHPLVLEVMGLREPKTSLQAKFSVYHAIAVAMLDGIASVRQFSHSRVRAPEVVDLRRRVDVTTDASVALDEVFLSAEYADGVRIDRHIVPGALGAMTAEALRAKVHSLADDVLGPAAVTRLLDTVSDIDHLSKVHHLTAVACRRGPS